MEIVCWRREREETHRRAVLVRSVLLHDSAVPRALRSLASEAQLLAIISLIVH